MQIIGSYVAVTLYHFFGAFAIVMLMLFEDEFPYSYCYWSGVTPHVSWLADPRWLKHL